MRWRGSTRFALPLETSSAVMFPAGQAPYSSKGQYETVGLPMKKLELEAAMDWRLL